MARINTNGQPVKINLFPGDILIPVKPYLYCLRIDKVSNDSDGWWIDSRPGYFYTLSTRFDITRERQPQFTNRNSGHIHIIREVAFGVYRDDDPQLVTGLPMYFRRWEEPGSTKRLF